MGKEANDSKGKDAPASTKPRRDVRADRLGFIDRLCTWAEKVKAALKESMHDGETVQGDYFAAKLSGTSSTTTTLDAKKLLAGLLKARDAKKVDDATVLKCVALNRKELEKLIGVVWTRAAWDKLVTSSTAPGTSRLNVDAIDGTEFELGTALQALHAAVTGDEARDAVLKIAA